MSDIKQIIKQEYIKCATDPVHFMKKYCFIQHPQRGKINFHLYPFQERVMTLWKDNPYSFLGFLYETNKDDKKVVAFFIDIVKENFYSNEDLIRGALERELATTVEIAEMLRDKFKGNADKITDVITFLVGRKLISRKDTEAIEIFKKLANEHIGTGSADEGYEKKILEELKEVRD